MVLMDQIKAIEVKFSNLSKKIDEEDKIALVFEKAPSNYAGILATPEKEKGNNLTLDDLEKQCNSSFVSDMERQQNNKDQGMR
eukprot:15361986-Ditylum_brightwellii.AAC.1